MHASGAAAVHDVERMLDREATHVTLRAGVGGRYAGAALRQECPPLQPRSSGITMGAYVISAEAKLPFLFVFPLNLSCRLLCSLLDHGSGQRAAPNQYSFIHCQESRTTMLLGAGRRCVLSI